ncbi:MAG: PLDc_N domain-containing protein [Bacteroidia bacterium]|nr:PLDc_N domain-containing protein [Bacteroidia bacterium]
MKLLFFNLGGTELIIILPILFPIIFWIWALIDILRSNFKDGSAKLVWLLVTVFVPLGFILYFIIGRKQRVK